MRIDVLTLFPDMVIPVLSQSIVGRAQLEGKVRIHVIDYRDFSEDKHHKVDDYPYGGGAGMVLRVEPVVKALQSIENYQTAHKILMTPQGVQYHQSHAKALSSYNHLIIMCGHYEGYDERIRKYFDEEISLGDFVLTGGEVAALAIIESAVRLIPGVLNKDASHQDDSFSDGLLEYPQYTRPREFEGNTVPDVLLSGNHQAIAEWRQTMALERTKQRRPDLYETYLKKQKKLGK